MPKTYFDKKYNILTFPVPKGAFDGESESIEASF